MSIALQFLLRFAFFPLINTSMSKPVSPIPRQAGNQQPRNAARQTISVIDMTRKRRSGSCDSPSIGQPFINPVNRGTRTKPRRSFFRTAASKSDPNSLTSLIANLTPSQAFRVSIMLRLNPPNLNTLREFVSRVTPQDQSMIDTIKNSVFSVVRKPEESAPLDYGFVDCRLSQPASSIDVISAPISLGEAMVNFHFVIPSLVPGQHLVVQPFIMGQTPPTIRWPISLRILVNEFQVKPPGFFPFSHIDLTNFGPGAGVRILCGIEQAKFLLFVRVAQYMSFREIVLKIQNEKPAPNDMINPNEITLFSPLSGNLMRHPGRGIQCGHTQCFDLKEFLERCSATQQWACPICRKPTHPKDLVYSLRTKALLYEMTKNSEINMVMNNTPNTTSNSSESDHSDEISNVNVFEDHGDGNFGFNFPEEEDGWGF